MLKNFVKILTFYFIINFSNIGNTYTKLFEPEIPNTIGINISWKYLKKYTDYINNLTLNPRGVIPSEFKDNFKSKIYFKDKENNLKILPSAARITGDWQDHIDHEKKISSLKINLKDSNIGNIVKFRLLLERTRDFEAEIFWSILLEELGYPVLYKKIVYVSINGLPKEKMLFEESPSKEFLERFSLRELPILEVDERQKWDREALAYKVCSELIHVSSLKKQNECLNDFFKNYDIRYGDIVLNWKVDNKSFLKNKTSEVIGLNGIVNINDENTVGLKNFIKLNKPFFHGLVKHNLKRIYDPIYNFYVPLYYDGNITQNSFKNSCENNNLRNKASKNLNKKLSKIKELYFLRTGSQIKDFFLCAANAYLVDENNYFSIDNILKQHNFQILPNLNNLEINHTFLQVDQIARNINFCLSKNKCKNIDDNKLREIIAGDYIFKDKNDDKVYPILIANSYNKTSRKLIKNSDKQNLSIQAKDSEIIFTQLDTNTKNIKIVFESESSRAVIYNSVLDNSNIIIEYKNNNEIYNTSTYDENLLTGCLTIIDSKLNNVSIKSENSKCEDAVNIVRSSGNIELLDIKNSNYDLVDFDFSKILIKKAKLKNSKNDCIDFSYGVYVIDEIEVSNCGDKGISVGEKSQLEVLNYNGIENKLDIAVKDSSVLYLHDFKSNKRKPNDCISAYKKKQEFDGGIIFFEASEINCKIKIDKYSNIKFNAKR